MPSLPTAIFKRDLDNKNNTDVLPKSSAVPNPSTNSTISSSKNNSLAQPAPKKKKIQISITVKNTSSDPASLALPDDSIEETKQKIEQGSELDRQEEMEEEKKKKSDAEAAVAKQTEDKIAEANLQTSTQKDEKTPDSLTKVKGVKHSIELTLPSDIVDDDDNGNGFQKGAQNHNENNPNYNGKEINFTSSRLELTSTTTFNTEASETATSKSILKETENTFNSSEATSTRSTDFIPTTTTEMSISETTATESMTSESVTSTPTDFSSVETRIDKNTNPDDEHRSPEPEPNPSIEPPVEHVDPEPDPQPETPSQDLGEETNPEHPDPTISDSSNAGYYNKTSPILNPPVPIADPNHPNEQQDVPHADDGENRSIQPFVPFVPGGQRFIQDNGNQGSQTTSNDNNDVMNSQTLNINSPPKKALGLEKAVFAANGNTGDTSGDKNGQSHNFDVMPGSNLLPNGNVYENGIIRESTLGSLGDGSSELASLGVGGIAGIVAGCVAVALLVFGLVVAKRKRRMQDLKSDKTSEDSNDYEEDSESRRSSIDISSQFKVPFKAHLSVYRDAPMTSSGIQSMATISFEEEQSSMMTNEMFMNQLPQTKRETNLSNSSHFSYYKRLLGHLSVFTGGKQYKQEIEAGLSPISIEEAGMNQRKLDMLAHAAARNLSVISDTLSEYMSNPSSDVAVWNPSDRVNTSHPNSKPSQENDLDSVFDAEAITTNFGSGGEDMTFDYVKQLKDENFRFSLISDGSLGK